MGTEFLKNIAVNIEKKQNNVFTYPVDKQKKYVARFPDPKDGFERGYYQYCCQMKLYGEPVHTFVNLAAFPLSLYYMLTFRASGEQETSKKDAVFFDDGKPFNIIPDSVLNEYNDILTLSSDAKQLTKEDKKFLKKIFKKYPFSWMLWLKTIIKVAQYSYAISKYAPKAVISCSEYSFTAPILTEYCHTRGVKLVNVMHGEKVYHMGDTFSKFDEFYVWNEEYVKLLVTLRADPEQFKIEIPQSLRIEGYNKNATTYDFTYYLGAENEEILKKISKSLKQLNDNGACISVRPHPRYSDMKMVKEYFEFANIEDVKEVTIEQSLLNTKVAVSLFSTVLNQAVCNSIPIVIDDISNVENFEKLSELGYVCLDKEHRLLSQIVGESL